MGSKNQWDQTPLIERLTTALRGAAVKTSRSSTKLNPRTLERRVSGVTAPAEGVAKKHA